MGPFSGGSGGWCLQGYHDVLGTKEAYVASSGAWWMHLWFSSSVLLSGMTGPVVSECLAFCMFL